MQPNIIVAQSESLLRSGPGCRAFQYERDPLENFHALESGGISGTFHSHYLGYGTGYLEMSMLYGITGWTSVLGRTSASWRMTPMRNLTPCRTVYQERLAGGDAPWV